MNPMDTEIKKRQSDNDARVREVLDSIIERGEHMSLEDKRFMKARFDYLTRSQKQEYAHILQEDLSSRPEEESKEKVTPEEEMIVELQERARAAGVKNPERFKTKKALNDAIASAQLTEGK